MIFSSSEDDKLNEIKKTEDSSESDESVEKDKFKETPASPDPSVSSDSGCQILPIIIPTERSADFTENKCNKKQSNSKIPVITITERTGIINISSSDSNHSDDVVFTEWDMLEESQKNNTKPKGSDWQSLTVSGHDVASTAKLVSSNLPQKINNDNRSYSMGSCSDIPTVPVPSLGGSRRLSSVLEKTKVLNLDINTTIVRAESPVNVPEVRLESPDPEILFSRSKVLSPKSKDSHGSPRTPTKTPMPLLVSPPPASNEPPLSIEDLEELLGADDEKDDIKVEKKREDAMKQKRDSAKQEMNLTKDSKACKESLSYLAAERESEKQWEEVDKHIIKLGGRKCMNVINAASAMIAKIESKSNEIKGPSDHRPPQSPSTSSKFEPRYADNYERHPRQRDIHNHENTKEKLARTENICRMPDQDTAQIPVLLNSMSNKMDERIPLYQRRMSGLMEGWKDTTPLRAENEFVIEGTDYYNMHNVSQLRWPVPSGDHQFGNPQWGPPAYSGMPNSSMPPYPRPLSMFMGGSPVDHTAVGSRTMLNPARSQDVRSENIRDDILMPTNVFPQPYRNFQLGQSSYEPGFERPAEYPHVRLSWDGPSGRIGESYNNDVIPCGIVIPEVPTGPPYLRSDTPCPWTRDRNRTNRGRGRESYYNERNRTEVRPNFSRDVRRLDRLRDIDRENPNRFSRDNRNVFERDPRVRMEHSATIPSQAKETSNSSSVVRDPRLAKDKHFSPTKDVKDATYNERDPRKRLLPSVTSQVALSVTSKKTVNKEKPKSQKSPEKRIDSDSSCKEKTDNLPKTGGDRMQSPLESLYGAIKSSIKSSHSSGLQKFKIPKIKRPELPQRPLQPSSTTSQVIDETKEVSDVTSKSPRSRNNSKKSSSTAVNSSVNLGKDGAVAEVSSTSNGNNVIDSLDSSLPSRQDDFTRESEIISSLVEETNKKRALDGMSIEITRSSERNDSETDGTKSKDEVTQEWVEALIRKSFESGEGKKLFEHAKLIQKLGEALQTKKLKKIQKKIQKIMESESESSNSDETIGPKRSLIRKKRRVIVSDSSDDECLAERLNILNTNIEANDERAETVSTDIPDSTKHSTKDKVDIVASNRLSEELAKSNDKENNGPSKDLSETSTIQTDDSSKIEESDISNLQLEKNNEQNDVTMEDHNDDNNQRYNLRSEYSLKKENDGLEINNEDISNCSENNQQLDSQLEGEEKKDETEDHLVNVDPSEKAQDMAELVKDEIDNTESVAEKGVEISSDKPKTKTKRRNSLEMLQEDIREMFISEEVVSATGFRMCRLSKENQLSSGLMGTSSKKDEAFNESIKESSIEVDESIASNAKSKKTTSKSRNSGESKSKSKGKKDVAQRPTRKLHSKESMPSSESEEDQPLALRTEWKLNNNSSNNTLRQEKLLEEPIDILRKSRRLLHKEPWVLVEKTDITKLDLSKMMFDSSSDESFSIDVSELTAAVDISLQPDKQSDQDSVDTVVNSTLQQKSTKRASKRSSKSKRKGIGSLLADCKSDDGMSFTDESVISDISMSSNTTAGKKNTMKTAVKEELLSNILVGLVPTVAEKSTIGKDNEVDFDEDTNCCPSPIETNAKKSLVRKKKKKWQLGILSKKKRKKTATATSSKVGQIEETSNETNASMDNVEVGSLVSGDNSIAMAETIFEETADKQLVDDANVDSSKCDKNLAQQLANTDNSNVAVDNNIESSDIAILRVHLNSTKEISSSESVSLPTGKKLTLETMEVEMAKVKTEEASNMKAETQEAETKPAETEETEMKPAKAEEAKMEETETKSAETESTKCMVTEPSTDVEETEEVSKIASSSIVYDEMMEGVFCDMNNRLKEYAWFGQDKYKCLLCFFSGKNIVHHYKILHPNKEVLISRLSPFKAEAAILETEKTIEDEAIPSSTTTNKVCKYRCRFCLFETEGAADVAIEAFYEHCTTHTGEYRFHCKSCTYKAVAKASMRTHYYKMCRKLNDTFLEATIEDDIPREDSVYGYLCCECNYVQLKRMSVEIHAKFWHRDKTDIKILRINMSTLTTKEVASDVQESQKYEEVAKKPFAEEIKEEVKPQVSDIEDKVPTPMDAEIDTILRTIDISDVTEPQHKRDDNSSGNCDLQQPQTNDEMNQENDMKMSVQAEPEGSMNTGNMSVFVCPPELENKEVEIQLERKKRMQEIVDDIGIKINKNLSKSSLSIIDKLQDKMRTDAIASPVDGNNESPNVSQENKQVPLSTTDSAMDLSGHEENLIVKENPLSQPPTDSQIEDPPFAKQSVSDNKTDTANNNNADKMDVKIRDPLAVMDSSKNSESDGEISDTEIVRRSPVYESDSSSEQSDSEPTDVNMILKETSNINASSSRDPMLTTIQRLAAQLQSAKPLEMPEVQDVKSESVSPILMTFFPKAPNVVSITSAQTSLLKQQSMDRGITPPISSSGSNTPKNFLRFRRLSGDMLSLPASDNQEDTQASSTGRCLQRDTVSLSIIYLLICKLVILVTI